MSAFKTLYQYSGGIRAGEFICKLPYNSEPLTQTVDDSLTKKTERFYKTIRNAKHKSLIDRLINFVALHIIMKPQVLKRPEQYKAVIERWKKNRNKINKLMQTRQSIIVGFLLFCSLVIHAQNEHQWKFGVEMGLNYSNSSEDTHPLKKACPIFPKFGVTVDWELSSKMLIHSGVFYNFKRLKSSGNTESLNANVKLN
jgi:hypothetical protein